MRKVKRLGISEFGLELELLNRAIQSSVDAALQLESMVAMARVLCPVDTGALAGSIRAERRGPHSASLVAGGEAYINPKTGRCVDYAAYVHEGTSWKPARPFLLQAITGERLPVARRMVTETLERI